ncbi:unnamed protein product [Effrenium voratum]|nr:unnamed protein product [Effrenium voratum]
MAMATGPIMALVHMVAPHMVAPTMVAPVMGDLAAVAPLTAGRLAAMGLTMGGLVVVRWTTRTTVELVVVRAVLAGRAMARTMVRAMGRAMVQTGQAVVMVRVRMTGAKEALLEAAAHKAAVHMAALVVVASAAQLEPEAMAMAKELVHMETWAMAARVIWRPHSSCQHSRSTAARCLVPSPPLLTDQVDVALLGLRIRACRAAVEGRCLWAESLQDHGAVSAAEGGGRLVPGAAAFCVATDICQWFSPAQVSRCDIGTMTHKRLALLSSVNCMAHCVFASLQRARFTKLYCRWSRLLFYLVCRSVKPRAAVAAAIVCT